MIDIMSYFMLKNVKNTMYTNLKFLCRKFIVNTFQVFIAITLFFSTIIMNVSCKTCKCPAYSMQEMDKIHTTGEFKSSNFLFDKRFENAKTGLNQSI